MSLLPVVLFLLFCTVLLTILYFRLQDSEERGRRVLSELEEQNLQLTALRNQVTESQEIVSGQTSQILSFNEIASILGQSYDFERSVNFAFLRMLELLKIDFGILILGKSDKHPVRVVSGIAEEEYAVLQHVQDQLAFRFFGSPSSNFLQT